MKKIYCITSGEYSDWKISYAFEDKNKRDELLKFLNSTKNYECFEEYEIELQDDNIDAKNHTKYYICNVSCYNKMEIEINEANTITRERKNEVVMSYKNKLYSYEFEIPKEEYENPKKYEEKWKKIFYDKSAEVNYMLSEGVNLWEVEKILNKE